MAMTLRVVEDVHVLLVRGRDLLEEKRQAEAKLERFRNGPSPPRSLVAGVAVRIAALDLELTLLDLELKTIYDRHDGYGTEVIQRPGRRPDSAAMHAQERS